MTDLSSLASDIDDVCDLINRVSSHKKRVLIGIAGPPGSGKSTLAEAVVKTLNSVAPARIPKAGLLPMDGFHLDNQTLEAHGLLDKKGAPETFDAHGFCEAVSGLQNKNVETFLPSFDREKDITTANSITIHQQTPIIVVEGNYLLLRVELWSRLKNRFAATVFMRPSLVRLQNRLQQRWLDQGLDMETARQKTAFNDMPNAHLVLEESLPADLTLTQTQAPMEGISLYNHRDRAKQTLL